MLPEIEVWAGFTHQQSQAVMLRQGYTTMTTPRGVCRGCPSSAGAAQQSMATMPTGEDEEIGEEEKEQESVC